MEKKSLIFIIDDITDTADLLAHFLNSSGYTTRTFTNGEDALKILESGETIPSLILVDLMMPGVDGIQVIRRIRSNDGLTYIPIIMITSSADSQTRILGLQTGADDFLAKPVNRAELLARVRSLSRLKDVYDEKVGLLTDVQEAYNRLAATQGELIEAEKRKSQMEAMMTTAAGICHEMSQPLTSALITLQLLRLNDNPKVVDDVSTIESSLLQARVILDKLRALTRYETKPYLGEELILDIDRSSETPLMQNFNQDMERGESDNALN
jgi:DNA-binding response OmpR family regulator